MSNTSVSYFHLLSIFVLDQAGGGSDVFVEVIVKGHTLIHSEGGPQFLKYPDPPLPRPIKNVPSRRIEMYKQERSSQLISVKNVTLEHREYFIQAYF